MATVTLAGLGIATMRGLGFHSSLGQRVASVRVRR